MHEVRISSRHCVILSRPHLSRLSEHVCFVSEACLCATKASHLQKKQHMRKNTVNNHFKCHSGKYQRLSNYIPLICTRMKRFSINLLVSILEMAENTNINCDKMSTENNKRMGPTKTFAMSSRCTKKAAVIQTLPVDWTPLNMQKYTMTQVTMRRPKSSQRIPPASLTPFVLSRSL